MVLAVVDRPTQQTAEPSEVWRCANAHCRRVLGVVTGPRVTIREGRREIVAALPCVQRCPTCGQWNQRD